MRVLRIIERPGVDAALSRLKGWWDGLSPRERVLVGTLGTLVALAVLVYGVIKPLQAIRADAYADIRTYQTLDARIRAAGTLGPSGPPPRSGAPVDIVNQSAAAASLAIQAEAVPGGVRVTIAEARYDAVLNWMADIARTSGLAATRVELLRRPTPGLVSATVEYRG